MDRGGQNIFGGGVQIHCDGGETKSKDAANPPACKLTHILCMQRGIFRKTSYATELK